jgi:hypothetical protein
MYLDFLTVCSDQFHDTSRTTMEVEEKERGSNEIVMSMKTERQRSDFINRILIHSFPPFIHVWPPFDVVWRWKTRQFGRGSPGNTSARRLPAGSNI